MNPSELPGPVLIVEDDRNTSSLVATYLEREGFPTVAAFDGATALEMTRQTPPGFVILDLNLPQVDGWEVCRELRKISDVPILMLTAREEEIDRVLGLSLGADDYVVKPFSPRELVERVKAILRRSRPRADRLRKVLHYAGLSLDLEKHKVTLNGDSLELTASEYKLLQVLMSAPGRVFSRQELLGRIYERGETVVDRVVDVHLGKLRQKLGDDPVDSKYILTVRGFGYRFADRDDAG